VPFVNRIYSSSAPLIHLPQVTFITSMTWALTFKEFTIFYVFMEKTPVKKNPGLKKKLKKKKK